MIHDRAMRSLGASSLAHLCLALLCCLALLGGVAACAGSERPQPTDEQEEQIAAKFVNGGSGASAGGSANNNGGNGGQGPAGGAGGGGGTGGCDAFGILEARCSGGSCHGAGSDLGDFAASLEQAEAFAGAAPVTPDCLEENLVIDPENPLQSLLVQKLDQTPPCGSPMPLVPPLLADEEVACLVQWIGTL
jgi:hypothetical protein